MTLRDLMNFVRDHEVPDEAQLHWLSPASGDELRVDAVYVRIDSEDPPVVGLR